MRKILAVFLAIQVAFPVCLIAQQPAAGPQPEPMVTGGLSILILEGAGAINNIQTRQVTPPVVEVRDSNDQPLEGATVIFRLPPSGPGATFAGQALSKTLKTNSQGQALAVGMLPNAEAGKFSIHVTATAGNRIGEIDINQTNSAKIFAAHTVPKRKISTKVKLLVIGVTIGAVIGIVLITTGGSSSAPANPTITIIPGPVTIGGR